MDGDNVDLVLVSDRRLIEAMRSETAGRSDLWFGEFPDDQLGLNGAEDGAYARVCGEGTGVDGMDLTDEERMAFERSGAMAYSYTIVGTRYDVVSDLIEIVSKVGQLAVYNDWDRVLTAPEFLALCPADQVLFMGAKHDAYLAEKRAAALQ